MTADKTLAGKALTQKEAAKGALARAAISKTLSEGRQKPVSDTAQISGKLRFMEKERKLELIQRSLGIRHKLKVHDSMKQPDTHEELAMMMLSKWELEDELHAIEQLLAEIRHENVQEKKHRIDKDNAPLVKKKLKTVDKDGREID